MKAEDIENMQAGREMDAIIAEKVFKLDAACWVEACEVEGHLIAEYSTDIAAAWEVVEKLDLFNRDLALMRTSGGYGIYPLVRDVTGAQVLDICHPVAKDETAPLAICRAALLAVGQDWEDKLLAASPPKFARISNLAKQESEK